MISVESAMRSVDKDWDLMRGEPLEGCDLLYPDQSICFRPFGTLTADGASVNLAHLTSLLRVHNVKDPCRTPGASDKLAAEAAEKLFVNGGLRAFPEDARAFNVAVKLRVSGRVRGGEVVGVSRYMCVPSMATVGRLCHLIAKDYKEFLEYAQAHKVMQLLDSVRRYRFSQAVLHELVLTKEVANGMYVWEARIQHQDEECATALPANGEELQDEPLAVQISRRMHATGHDKAGYQAFRQDPRTGHYSTGRLTFNGGRPLPHELLTRKPTRVRHPQNKPESMFAGDVEAPEEESLKIQIARRMHEMGHEKAGYNAFRQDPCAGQY